MRKYVELKENTQDITHLKTEVYYCLGGTNYFTGEPKKRGYYVSVTPVKKWTQNGVKMESFVAFTGFSKLIKEVSRKSKAAEMESRVLSETMIFDMISTVCAARGLEVKA